MELDITENETRFFRISTATGTRSVRGLSLAVSREPDLHPREPWLVYRQYPVTANLGIPDQV